MLLVSIIQLYYGSKRVTCLSQLSLVKCFFFSSLTNCGGFFFNPVIMLCTHCNSDQDEAITEDE